MPAAPMPPVALTVPPLMATAPMLRGVWLELLGFVPSLMSPMLGNMNRIDMGIALAHLYVANEDTFRFFKAENVVEVPGYGYIGSVTL